MPESQGKAAITGVVTGSDGKPLAQVAVLIVGDSPPHRDIAAATDSQGRYRLDGLLPGRYSILANASGYPTATRQVEAAAGQVARLDFRLAK
jgi:protocatechuate 3,4-dioxygenase beta subunit